MMATAKAQTLEVGGFRGKIKKIYRKHYLKLVVLTLIALFVIVLLAKKIFIIILPGERGVLFRVFTGTDISRTYDEGLNIIFPLNRMIRYSVRIQQRREIITILSRDGLPITIEYSLRFRPKIDPLPILHKEIGSDYFEKVVLPEFNGAIRDVMSNYRPDELYAIHRDVVQREVVNIVLKKISEKYITVDDFLLLNIELPPMVRQAIERKLSQEQLQFEYQYRVEVAKLEAKRKLIEAEGIRDFQQTVSDGISPSYLKWKGIEATLELSQSQNAKVVVIGSGENNGLPLILNLASEKQGETQKVLKGKQDSKEEAKSVNEIKSESNMTRDSVMR